MKKILLSTFGILMIASLSAQTIVSTSVEKRAPVLEEFTGVNCPNCPDGHKIAQALKDANSDAVLINIHSGVFAPFTPPYRTPFGDAIDALAGVVGYPAGSINRNENIPGVTSYQSGSAMGRQHFQSAAGQIESEDSPVNIAIDPSFNEANGELTVLVEVYYTDSTDTNDFLHIGILQSNVKGPQSGASVGYSEMMYDDGDYNHNHMLRHLITGQWGWDIRTTGEDFFWDTTITYTLPATLNGLATNWKDMEVVAFISDTQEDIYTGVSSWFLPKSRLWDLTSVTNINIDGLCADEAVVDVEITNNGTHTIEAFDVSYSLNGGISQSHSFSGSLAPHNTTTVNFTIGIEAGVNVISFDRFQNVVDDDAEILINPTVSGFFSRPEGVTTVHVLSGQESPIADDFEGVNVGDDAEKFYVLERASGIWPIVVANSYYQNVPEILGGFGESDQSLFFPLGFSTIATGSAYSVVSDNYDLQGYEYADLQFSYAYGSLVASDNTDFTVEVSIDCGETWQTIHEAKGEDMNTAGVDGVSIIFPEDDEWKKVEVNMNDFVGEADVMVRFRIVKDQTNVLYLDDIDMINYPLGVEGELGSEISVYPNPATNRINLENTGEEAVIEIINLEGRTVLVVQDAASEIDISSLSAGVYNIFVTNTKGVMNTKLTILE